MTDEEMKEKVLTFDIQLKLFTKSLGSIAKELHEIASSMKEVAVMSEKMDNINTNLRDGLLRVHNRITDNEEIIKNIRVEQNKTGCPVLNLKSREITQLKNEVYGKDGRGGLVFSDAENKKFIYKLMGFVTAINLIVVIAISIFIK